MVKKQKGAEKGNKGERERAHKSENNGEEGEIWWKGKEGGRRRMKKKELKGKGRRGKKEGQGRDEG